MIQESKRDSLRGGGCVCSSKVPQENGLLVQQSGNQSQIIGEFFVSLDGQCLILNELTKSIQLQQSQDSIISIIKYIQCQAQFINDVSRKFERSNLFIKQVLQNLESLLDSITNTIASSLFVTLQILKVCNLLSRLIFQYYANKQCIPISQERQQSILNLIEQIEEMLGQGGEQLYYNSICYELFIIKICIEICPTDSKEGMEVIFDIISGIQSSLEGLSADLLISLLQGGFYLYKYITKWKQIQTFNIVFYLEELKFRLIENIQQGQGINKAVKQLAQNYDTLIRKSNQWLIKCSWIKIMSELLLYKPIITLEQFKVIQKQHGVTTDWDQLINLRIIKIIDNKQSVAFIQHNSDTSRINQILQQQMRKFQIIQDSIINGEKNLPMLEELKQFTNQVKGIDDQQIHPMAEHLYDLPFTQILYQLKEYQQKIIQQVELVQDFIEEIDNQNDNQQYLQQQIEQIIAQGETLSNIRYQVLLHNHVIIQAFKIQNQNVQIKNQTTLFVNYALQYLEIVKTIKCDVDKNLQFNFYIFMKEVADDFGIGKANGDFDNIIEISKDLDKADDFIKALKEIKKNDKNKCQEKDLNQFIKILQELIKRIECSTENIVTRILLCCKSHILFDLNTLIQIKENFQNSYIKTLFFQFSRIQTLVYIFQYIDNNKDVLKEKAQKTLDQNLDIDIDIDIELIQSLFTLRIQELKIPQEDIKLIKEVSQQELDQKICYLNIISYAQAKILGQFKILSYDIQKVVDNFKSLKLEPNIQKIQFQNIQVSDQIQENSEQLMKDIDNTQFMNLIQRRFELCQQLPKNELNYSDQIEFLKLIIEHYHQSSENLYRDDIINIIQKQDNEIQQTKINQNQQQYKQTSQKQVKEVQNYNQQEAQNSNQQQKVVEIVALKTKEQIEEQQNNYILQIRSYILYIKLQKLQGKELDEQREMEFQQLVKTFESIEVEIQSFLNNQLQSLETIRPKSLSISQIKLIVPSYKELLDRELDQQEHQLKVKERAMQYINDQFTNEVWRIKDYLYYNCLAFIQQLSEKNQKIVGNLLLMARFKETDYRIINILKGRDQIQKMETLINAQWEVTQNEVMSELQMTLNELQSIQFQLQSEGRKDLRESLTQKHKKIEQQLEQQIKNVNEIGDVLGVTIHFLKDIKRDLISIQSKLDSIVSSIDQIGYDIKYLRGKSPQQLLEIRMQNVLENKIYQDAQSMYVQMKTKEFDLENNKEVEIETPLFNTNNKENGGEIDEFLSQDKKSSLLIHGAAGAGKSLTSRKIEEYLWQQYQNKCQNQSWSVLQGSPPSIPIFIQLPTLKDPKFNAIEETLLSQLYRFDQKQIDQLNDQVQNSQIKLIFIMDSYDELAQQFRSINLIQSNKIYIWKSKNQENMPKVITTSRSDAFSKENYREWFWESKIRGFESLKEIRLLPFNVQQRQEFVQQFSHLKLKTKLYELLQVISKNQNRYQILQDTLDIYEKLNPSLQNEQSYLLNNKNFQLLIKLIKDSPNVTIFNQEQEISFSKQILCLWHANLYINSIRQMDLYNLLETPYMLSIVVEVLPQINSQASQPGRLKQTFIINYNNLIKKFLQSKISLFDINPQSVIYTPEEVEQFRQYQNNGNQMKLDSQYIWECLNENQFFKNWNIFQSFEKTEPLIKIIQIQNKELFKIIDKDNDLTIIIYKSLKSYKLTLYDFFDKFIDQFIENQREKLIFSNDIKDQNSFRRDINQFALLLSRLMFERQETVIERKPQSLLFRSGNDDPYEQFFDESDLHGEYRKLIRSCIPISQKGNYYQFKHKSIQEFLLSKQCFRLFEMAFQVIDLLNPLITQLRIKNQNLELEELQKQNQINAKDQSKDKQKQQILLIKILQDIEIEILNKINLQDTLNLGVLKFLQNQIAQTPDLQAILYPLVLLSSVNDKYIRFSSNCLIILLQISQFQGNKDFSKMKISEISIDGAIFENCNLSKTQFDKVSINGLNLNFSDISDCEWTNLYLNDFFQFKGQSSSRFSFSPDEQLILNYNERIIVLDRSGMQQYIIDCKSTTLDAVFSSNNKFIYSIHKNNYFRIWNVEDGTQFKEHSLGQKFTKLILNENGDKIAFQNDKQILIINDLQNIDKKIILNDHLEKVLISKFEKQHFYTVSIILEIKVQLCIFLQQKWDYENGSRIGFKIEKQSINLCPDKVIIHKELFFFSSIKIESIKKWNFYEFQPMEGEFRGHQNIINSIDVSYDGKYLVSSSFYLMIIHDVKSFQQIRKFNQDDINLQVQFLLDGNLIIKINDQGIMGSQDTKGLSNIKTHLKETSSIKSLCFTKDSNQLIYFNKNQIIVNELETYQIESQLQDEDNQIKTIALHPNGKYFMYTTDYLIKIFDLRLAEQVGQTKKIDVNIDMVAYSPNGKNICIVSKDIIQFYDSDNLELLKQCISSGESLRFTHNNGFVYYWFRYYNSKPVVSQEDDYQKTVMYRPTEFKYGYVDLDNMDEEQHINIDIYLVSIEILKTQNTFKAYSISWTGQFIIWDFINRDRNKPYAFEKNLEHDIATDLIISPDHNYLFIGTQGGNIFAVDLQNDQNIFQVASFWKRITKLYISPNQMYLTAITQSNNLKIIKLQIKNSDLEKFIQCNIPQSEYQQQTLIYKLNQKNSIIKTHEGLDLKIIFDRIQKTQK